MSIGRTWTWLAAHILTKCFGISAPHHAWLKQALAKYARCYLRLSLECATNESEGVCSFLSPYSTHDITDIWRWPQKELTILCRSWAPGVTESWWTLFSLGQCRKGNYNLRSCNWEFLLVLVCRRIRCNHTLLQQCYSQHWGKCEVNPKLLSHMTINSHTVKQLEKDP